jgi:hypothetical protein
MQQAETVDTIDRHERSGGKSQKITPTFRGLTRGPVGAAINGLQHDLSEVRTLLSALIEVCDEATDERGIYARLEGWQEARFYQVRSLANIIYGMTETADKHSEQAWDGLVAVEIAA